MAKLAEALRIAMNSRISNVHTCFPGVVTNVNNDFEVDVLPSVYPESNGSIYQLPVIVQVPVAFHQTPTAGIRFRLKVGDPVTVYISEYDLSEWIGIQKNRVSEPVATKKNVKHAFANAFVVPGLLPESTQEDIDKDAELEIRTEKNTITIKTNGDIVIGGKSATRIATEALASAFGKHTHAFVSGAVGPVWIDGAPALPEEILSWKTSKTEAE